MNASIWQGPSGPLIGHISLGVLSKLKPRASSALVETVYGMDEGTIGPLWARNTPSDNEIRTAHGRICIFILLEADRTSIPSIVSHGRTMNVVVVDIPSSWRMDRRGPEVVFWETEPIPPLTRRSRPLGLSAPARHKRWVAVKLRFSPPETSPVFRSDELVRSPKKHLATRSEEHTSELQSLRHLVCRL